MLSILGMGYAHPTTVIDNKFIENLNVGTNEQWILEKIGIETRLSSLPLDYISSTRNADPSKALEVSNSNCSELALRAAKMALQRAGISERDVGLVLMNCCTPSHLIPSEATKLCEQLNIVAPAYEVFTACPVFALHVDYLCSMREDTLPDYVLCVSTATLTQCVNYNDRSDGAIWGDGAAAWIVSPRKVGKLAVRFSHYTADPTRAKAVVVDTGGHFHQDGRAVRDFSVRQTVRLIKQIEDEFKIDWSRDVFIGHQANATMLEQITNNRGIPPQNHWHNVRTIGNQAGASAPAVLAMKWEDLKPGQRVVVAVVGAGLSWGSMLLEAV